VNYFPTHLQPVFGNHLKQSQICPNAQDFYAQEISLPMWPGLLDFDPEIFTEIAKIVVSN
jgi:dTDP-4-amino-4,6-dideoxygalactose transaminase